jgi:hypothetical protein
MVIHSVLYEDTTIAILRWTSLVPRLPLYTSTETQKQGGAWDILVHDLHIMTFTWTPLTTTPAHGAGCCKRATELSCSQNRYAVKSIT